MFWHYQTPLMLPFIISFVSFGGDDTYMCTCVKSTLCRISWLPSKSCLCFKPVSTEFTWVHSFESWAFELFLLSDVCVCCFGSLISRPSLAKSPPPSHGLTLFHWGPKHPICQASWWNRWWVLVLNCGAEYIERLMKAASKIISGGTRWEPFGSTNSTILSVEAVELRRVAQLHILHLPYQSLQHLLYLISIHIYPYLSYAN